MKNLGSEKALSAVVAAIILISVTIVVSIVVAAWMGALTFSFIGGDLAVKINARIYSANHNIAVLNEEAVFDIAIENNVNSTRKIDVLVGADEYVLFNETIVIEPVSSKNLTITQKLIFLGLWTIQFFEDRRIFDGEDKEIVGGYSFITVVNKAEADMKITQLDNIKLDMTLSIGAIIISILSAIVTIINVMYTRKRYIREIKIMEKKEALERSWLTQEAKEIALKELVEEEKQRLRAEQNNQKETPG